MQEVAQSSLALPSRILWLEIHCEGRIQGASADSKEGQRSLKPHGSLLHTEVPKTIVYVITGDGAWLRPAPDFTEAQFKGDKLAESSATPVKNQSCSDIFGGVAGSFHTQALQMCDKELGFHPGTDQRRGSHHSLSHG